MDYVSHLTKSLVLCAFSLCAISQTKDSRTPSKPMSSGGVDPCLGIEEAFYRDGYAKGHQDGVDQVRSAYTVNVGSNGKQKIALIIEHMEGEESFRKAAQKVIRGSFSDFFQIDKDADLYLHITGSAKIHTSEGDIRYVGASVYALAFKNVTMDSQSRIVRGVLQFARDGDVVQTFGDREGSDVIDALVKRVLRRYKTAWANGSVPRGDH